MSGDETRRFCSYCKKDVHNLEAMNVSERLALLSSPAASICARYKIAIRRPAKGKKESYMRHMLKYGAGVAVCTSALIILWEMHADEQKHTYYRAVAARPPAVSCPPIGGCGLPGVKPPGEAWPDAEWPEALYVEVEAVILGGFPMCLPKLAQPAHSQSDDATATRRHIDLDLDQVELNRLLQPAKPAILKLKPADPLKDKKTGKRRLRGWGV